MLCLVICGLLLCCCVVKCYVSCFICWLLRLSGEERTLTLARPAATCRRAPRSACRRSRRSPERTFGTSSSISSFDAIVVAFCVVAYRFPCMTC